MENTDMSETLEKIFNLLRAPAEHRVTPIMEGMVLGALLQVGWPRDEAKRMIRD